MPEIQIHNQATVVREDPFAYIPCPACGCRLFLPTLLGATWVVRSPADIANRLIPAMAPLEREELRVLTLNTKNRILDMQTVYAGCVNSTLVRVGELFREAVRTHAAGIILVHNHPSGDPTPSPDDLHLTTEAIAGGKLLDVRVLDHLIIAGDGYTSLRDRGLVFQM